MKQIITIILFASLINAASIAITAYVYKKRLNVCAKVLVNQHEVIADCVDTLESCYDLLSRCNEEGDQSIIYH